MVFTHHLKIPLTSQGEEHNWLFLKEIKLVYQESGPKLVKISSSMKEIKKLPVITLPNVVFFPNTSLPLYVVDPGYEQLIESTLEKPTQIAIAMSNDNYNDSEDILLNPHTICGVGEAVVLEKVEDDILKVLMRGQTKAKLLEVDQHLPYPVYQAEIIREDKRIHERDYYYLERLKLILSRWLNENIVDTFERTQFMSTITTPGQVIDYISTFLIKDNTLRQLLLERDSISQRMKLLNVLLKDYLPYQEDYDTREAIKGFESIEKLSKCAH